MRALFDDRPTRVDVPDVEGSAAFVALARHERAEFEVEPGGLASWPDALDDWTRR